MSIANPLWGASRIHGELLKLGITSGRRRWHTWGSDGASTVARMEDLSSHSCRRHRLDDLFVVPTIGFQLLYALVILQHARRELLRLAVTAHPTAEWVARQITEAWLARCTALPGARSRPCLWQRLHPANSRHGHSRPPHLGPFTLAEWMRGEADRLHPT